MASTSAESSTKGPSLKEVGKATSADNDNPPSGRRLSFSEMIILNSVWDHREKTTDENTPRGRKLSFTEKVLGSPEKHHGGFSWGHGKQERERKMSMEEVGAERNFTEHAVGSPDNHKGGFWGHGRQERERKMSMEEGGADKHEELKRHKEMPKWRSQDITNDGTLLLST